MFSTCFWTCEGRRKTSSSLVSDSHEYSPLSQLVGPLRPGIFLTFLVQFLVGFRRCHLLLWVRFLKDKFSWVAGLSYVYLLFAMVATAWARVWPSLDPFLGLRSGFFLAFQSRFWACTPWFFSIWTRQALFGLYLGLKAYGPSGFGLWFIGPAVYGGMLGLE